MTDIICIVLLQNFIIWMPLTSQIIFRILKEVLEHTITLWYSNLWITVLLLTELVSYICVCVHMSSHVSVWLSSVLLLWIILSNCRVAWYYFLASLDYYWSRGCMSELFFIFTMNLLQSGQFCCLLSWPVTGMVHLQRGYRFRIGQSRLRPTNLHSAYTKKCDLV